MPYRLAILTQLSKALKDYEHIDLFFDKNPTLKQSLSLLIYNYTASAFFSI